MRYRQRLIARNSFLFLIFTFVISVFCHEGNAGEYASTIVIQKEERWWAGVISESHRMPLHNADYSFDSYADTAGNQVQPLLLSNQGRYIWSEDPFRFEFTNGGIHLYSRFNSIQTGSHGSSLKDVYQYASKTFFPPSGKIPDPLLFTKPQFNTWIEFTYNQNQKDILDYAHKIVENGFPPGVC